MHTAVDSFLSAVSVLSTQLKLLEERKPFFSAWHASWVASFAALRRGTTSPSMSTRWCKRFTASDVDRPTFSQSHWQTLARWPYYVNELAQTRRPYFLRS